MPGTSRSLLDSLDPHDLGDNDGFGDGDGFGRKTNFNIVLCLCIITPSFFFRY